MEGPKALRREATECRGVGLGRGYGALPQYGVWGQCLQKILKFNSANLFIFFQDFKTEIALPSIVFHSFTAYICSS